jgi:CubicO group peptidase (beta-lactamase class C family)
MKIYKIILFLLVLSIGFYIYQEYPRLNIISGYAAKNMCSCMYEADRDPDFIEKTDNNFSPINIADYQIDDDTQRVTASVFGLMKRTAVYREDLGCQLLVNNKKLKQYPPFPVPHNCPPPAPYPYGHEPQKDTIFKNINYENLQKAVNNTFDKEGVDSLLTRAVLVIYKDHIIAEKYDDGFTKDSKILGWSMTKSLLATLFGVLDKEGKINLNANHLFPEWENDKRADITLNNLLQMSSGLEWEENYNEISDVTNMLFLNEDMTKTQLLKPLQFPIGDHWNYSSGTTNLLSGYLRNQFENYQDYLDFPVTHLYDKLALKSMSMELDLAGNYVGSSYGWATPRDWAKIGLLYLHKGNWNGTQILNESWVDYVSTPCKNSNGEYGAHFWLNAGGIYPDVPKTIFSMNGYQGQRVFIIPSKEMVVVRMGLTEGSKFDFNKMLKEIIININ